LAQLTSERIANRQAARVLIGGLGMGFTLAAALRSFGSDALVVVAELVPAVLRWNLGVLGEASGRPLADARASVHDGDVAELIRKPPAPWDAVLLDVDNGPVALTRSNNNWLYSPQGLQAAFHALKPKGILAVWSAAPDAAFSRRFERAGFAVECLETRARGKQGGRQHTIWLGTRNAKGGNWY
jgi:spermidine synthase